MARIVVEPQEDGPYLVIVDGKPLASLCRCGLSSSKPLCDGSHERSGFTAPGPPVVRQDSPTNVAPVINREPPIAEPPFAEARPAANVGPVTEPEVRVGTARVMEVEAPFGLATPAIELDRMTAVPVAGGNICKSCGHMNPEWVRSYCVRCAARLKPA